MSSSVGLEQALGVGQRHRPRQRLRNARRRAGPCAGLFARCPSRHAQRKNERSVERWRASERFESFARWSAARYERTASVSSLRERRLAGSSRWRTRAPRSRRSGRGPSGTRAPSAERIAARRPRSARSRRWRGTARSLLYSVAGGNSSGRARHGPEDPPRRVIGWSAERDPLESGRESEPRYNARPWNCGRFARFGSRRACSGRGASPRSSRRPTTRSRRSARSASTPRRPRTSSGSRFAGRTTRIRTPAPRRRSPTGSPTARSRRSAARRSGSTARRSRSAAQIDRARRARRPGAPLRVRVRASSARTSARSPSPRRTGSALLAATKADLELVFLLTRAPLAGALSTRRTPGPLGDRSGRRAPRRLSHLGLRRPRRAPGPRQERRGDHRRRPPPLRDGARLLEGSGGGEASGRPLQALRDRGHGFARRRSFARSTACSRASRRGILRGFSSRARAIFDLVEHSDAGAAFDALQAHSRIRPAFVAVRAACPADAPDAEGDAASAPLARGAVGGLERPRRLGARGRLLRSAPRNRPGDDRPRRKRVLHLRRRIRDRGGREEGRAGRRSSCARRRSPTSRRSSASGDRLPQKSTHFFPKMYSGIFGVSLDDAVY